MTPLDRWDDSTISLKEGEGKRTGPREPHLVLLLECARPLARSSRHALAGIERVEIGRGRARRWERAAPSLTLEVPDPAISLAHARLPPPNSVK